MSLPSSGLLDQYIHFFKTPFEAYLFSKQKHAVYVLYVLILKVLICLLVLGPEILKVNVVTPFKSQTCLMGTSEFLQSVDIIQESIVSNQCKKVRHISLKELDQAF